QNHDALLDFFARVHPKYASRTWFITGSSYAGIYIPTVVQRLLRSIAAGRFPNPHLQGFAIGNAYLNDKNNTNSLVLFGAYHGMIGVR
ncbi:Protein F32A5.3, partial [Aphelenchoides avenae]